MKKLKNSISKLGLRIIRFLARKLHLSLLDIGLSESGYTKSYSLKASGEESFVSTYLPKYLSSSSPIIFDVGSNIGQYASLIQHHLPNAVLHCFEPNPKTFEGLKSKLNKNAILNQIGMSNEQGEMELYFQRDNTQSVQASLNPNVISTVTGELNLDSTKVRIDTIDNYCTNNKIDRIDFLKIDTEGFELEVLHGSKNLLAKSSIQIIQFEFNEVNIVKRRFIKDFYDLLPNYSFFRLDENRMIPMNNWTPNHEVFRFQNIVAILN